MLGLLPEPHIQFADANGKPLDGGFLYTCLPGGAITDLKASYQDAAGITPNANPVELDSAGRAIVFLSGFYHIFLTDALGVAIYDLDNVSASSFFSAITVQWQLYPAVATYLSGTTFSLPGNVASDFPLGRRVQAALSASVIYGTVTGVSAGGGPIITTVTVIWDTSTGLDGGLAGVYTGIITPMNVSSFPVTPGVLLNASQALTKTQMNQLIVGSSTGAMSFTLPTAIPSGTWTRIHNAGTNNITLVGTINLNASPILAPQADANLFFDGSSWWGSFFDAAHGSFTTSLEVGSENGFPAFTISDAGDVTVTGGTDTVWSLLHAAATSWTLYGDSPIYYTPTAFKLSGLVLGDFPDGTRLKIIITAGTLYGTVLYTTFDFHFDTIVGVTLDAGVLDASISAIYKGTSTTVPILSVDALNNVNILTRGYVAVDPTDALEIATKQYVDAGDLAEATALAAATAIGGIKLVGEPSIFAGGAPIGGGIWPDTPGTIGNAYYTIGGINGTLYNGNGGNPGGLFHNVRVNAACNAYFHFFGTWFRTVAGGSYPFFLNLRMGYATAPAASVSPSSGTLAFPSPFVPTAYSTVFQWTVPGAGYSPFFDHIVIGPLALTAESLLFFVQIGTTDASGAVGNFDILGGLYMTLSAT